MGEKGDMGREQQGEAVAWGYDRGDGGGEPESGDDNGGGSVAADAQKPPRQLRTMSVQASGNKAPHSGFVNF